MILISQKFKKYNYFIDSIELTSENLEYLIVLYNRP